VHGGHLALRGWGALGAGRVGGHGGRLGSGVVGGTLGAVVDISADLFAVVGGNFFVMYSVFMDVSVELSTYICISKSIRYTVHRCCNPILVYGQIQKTIVHLNFNRL